jgi:SAM-dependent methyltransferase
MDNGWILLRDPESSYRDGGEDRVRQIIDASPDEVLPSTGDAMVRQAGTWAERYHLHPARANALRALTLPADARVLEVGAGCGAVTRYLGETCAVVDALEPVPARAGAARARTRDLPGVEVFVGSVDDVPTEPVYDVIAVVGVLEYVAGGSADRQPYLAFLRRLRRLLRPGGTLVVAIENKLGVKYLCGAPEDHSGRPYDSIEGYPAGAPARTFSRAELAALLHDAGLRSRSLIAFPDYKLTRVVFDPAALPARARSLLHRVPDFPSPDYLVQRGPGPAEALVWQSLAQAGLAADTGNSFLVLASVADADQTAAPGQVVPSPLWPPGRAGQFFAINRSAPYAVRTEITCHDGTVTFERSLVHPDGDRRNALGLTLHPHRSDYVDGIDLLDAVTDTGDERTTSALRRWQAMVERACQDGPAALDLIPRNLVQDETGDLVVIDQEWSSALADTQDVLRRGVLLTAVHLWLHGRLTGHWEGCDTVADVARSIAAVVGPDWEPGWLDRAVTAEVALQAEVSIVPGARDRDDAQRRAADFFWSALQSPVPRPVSDGPTAATAMELARSLHQAQLRIQALSGEVERALAEAESHRRSRELQAERAEAELARAQQTLTELEALRATLSWRVTAPLRWLRARLPR